MNETTTLPLSLRCAAEAYRRVRPTAADQRRNPTIDVMQGWRDDIEYTIMVKALTDEQAAAFRAACGL